jgi:hypothetical protein
VASSILIVAAALGIVGLAVLLALALALAAARADEHSALIIADHTRDAPHTISATRASRTRFSTAEDYWTVSVPSMPAARWPGTEQ